MLTQEYHSYVEVKFATTLRLSCLTNPPTCRSLTAGASLRCPSLYSFSHHQNKHEKPAQGQSLKTVSKVASNRNLDLRNLPEKLFHQTCYSLPPTEFQEELANAMRLIGVRRERELTQDHHSSRDVRLCQEHRAQSLISRCQRTPSSAAMLWGPTCLGSCFSDTREDLSRSSIDLHLRRPTVLVPYSASPQCLLRETERAP